MSNFEHSPVRNTMRNNQPSGFKPRQSNTCPKCGSDNTTLKEDDRDEWADLCILCFACGYDEREIKHKNADTLKAWQKIADNRIKQLNKNI